MTGWWGRSEIAVWHRCAMHAGIHLCRSLKCSLWPCLEPSFREMRVQGLKKKKKALRTFSAFIYAFLPLQKNCLLLYPGWCPWCHSLPVSTLSLPGSRSSRGCFQPTRCSGARAPGQTQLGAQPRATASHPQLTAQCGNHMLLSCLALPICKLAVPIKF